MRWSDLDLDPEQLKARLARIGTSPSELVADLYDALPEEREWYDQASFAEQLHRALVYFGDHQHLQPTVRTEWMIGRTRDWPGGRLPPLDEAL